MTCMHTGRAKDRHFSVNNTSELRNRMSEKPRASLPGIQQIQSTSSATYGQQEENCPCTSRKHFQPSIKIPHIFL